MIFRSLVKNCPEFIRTSMLTFFNNTAEDLGQTIQNLRDVSIWAFKGILLLYLKIYFLKEISMTVRYRYSIFNNNARMYVLCRVATATLEELTWKHLLLCFTSTMSSCRYLLQCLTILLVVNMEATFYVSFLNIQLVVWFV